MVKVPTNLQPDKVSPAPGKQRPHSKSVWAGIMLALIVIIIATVAGAFAVWPRSSPVVVSFPTPTPVFVPKVGDVDAGDLDDGATVALGAIPSFQFKSGGYTLSGVTIDARSKRPVGGVSVWITLPPALGQRTAPELRSVSTLAGEFSFPHLATGKYDLAAARYYLQNGNGQFMYPEVVQTRVVVPQKSSLRLSLQPQPAPGKRYLTPGVAKNLIILDMSGIYADSWFDDPALQLEASNMRAFAASGASATEVNAPYGWHPADQYALLSGTYPSWRVYDPWPNVVPWGTPDGIDTTFWYNSDPTALNFGQESLFDVALGYGMSTAALGGPRYALSDVSTRGVQTTQVGLVFDSAGWLATAQHLIQNMASNPNGFVFYSELDPPFGPAGAAGAIPDAPGGAYARAMQADDELLGLLRNWLANAGLLSNTVILVTASEAQVNETAFDNYYGMGPQGVGSSLHVPLVISGPGIAKGIIDQNPVSSFALAATATRALCLPAPANVRVQAITSLFSNHCA
jgi:hypothetical protein